MKFDIAYLIYSYNLVGAFSTFINYIIKYNKNLKSFWYFNFDMSNYPSYYCVFFCFDFYYNIKRYRMDESNYYNLLKKCNNFEEQKQLMISYGCPNKIFEIK